MAYLNSFANAAIALNPTARTVESRLVATSVAPARRRSASARVMTKRSSAGIAASSAGL
jgi:hypothetical protein